MNPANAAPVVRQNSFLDVDLSSPEPGKLYMITTAIAYFIIHMYKRANAMAELSACVGDVANCDWLKSVRPNFLFPRCCYCSPFALQATFFGLLHRRLD